MVAWQVSRSTFHDIRPAMAVTTIEPSAPIEAASVGAATPPMIEPSTDITSSTGGTTTLKKRVHSSRRETASRSSTGIGGTSPGRSMPMTTI
ncbi:hypothetical protein D3C83_50260 [compost metagenome]